MTARNKLVAISFIATQVLTIFSPVSATATENNGQSPPSSLLSADKVAGTATMLGASFQNGTLNDAVAGMAASQTATTVQDWFSQFGTAQVNLRIDNKLSLKNSSADVLVPLLNGERNIFFTQVGLRDNDGYFTANLGLGYRNLFNEWMFGSNLFWDATWNNVNHRFGAGLEAWLNFLKWSANG